MRVGLLSLLALLMLAPALAEDPERDTEFDVVVLDPGHGGADFGARTAKGVLEKDVVLQLSQRIGEALRARGLKVVFTRKKDRFLSLAERADVANKAKGDLYLSIHANSARNSEARGPETYFLSQQASDEEALRVAMVENEVFGHEAGVEDSDDIVGSILGDLIVADHMRSSSEIASSIQRNLADLGARNRGVKQAPFVVLMGVNMPAALLEVGFLTNPKEAQLLTSRAHQRSIADAVARAVVSYRDARNGRLGEEAAR